MENVASAVLARGARGLAPYVQPGGELLDPVFHEPTQYGTAYYAYVNAALVSLGGGALLLDRAVRGVEATLDHLLDPDGVRPATRFYPGIGSPSYANLRDFMWPPVLRALRLLQTAGADTSAIETKVASVEVPGAFSKRPPVNWASVWMVGEWLRVRAGLSPRTEADVDGWLQPFFDEAIDLERGVYHEPGWPNTYDLFTRVHLLYLLDEGYAGRYAEPLRRLLVTGLRRSLAVQLSDGSLATAHRSSGQTWTLGAQVSYFHLAARLLADSEPAVAAQARAAAVRSLHALSRVFRANGELSPVQNVFPASDRIGYEAYTSDPHYVALPLGFLATAVLDGFTGDPSDLAVSSGDPCVLAEGAPLHRGLVHAHGWSVHVNLNPHDGYRGTDPALYEAGMAHVFDSFGIADVVLGEGRRLRFGGQVHHMATSMPLTLGLAVRRPDDSVVALSTLRPTGAPELVAGGAGLRGRAALDGLGYHLDVDVDGEQVHVVEGVPDERVSLLVPYLRDGGDGLVTDVSIEGPAVRFRVADEAVDVVVHEDVERAIHLTHGYESRHGLVGLVRLDLSGAGTVRYDIRRRS